MKRLKEYLIWKEMTEKFEPNPKIIELLVYFIGFSSIFIKKSFFRLFLYKFRFFYKNNGFYIKISYI